LYSREVARSLLVFCLLFRQEAREGDDVSVNPLCAGTGIGFAVAVSSHGGFCMLMLNSKEQWRNRQRKREQEDVPGTDLGRGEDGSRASLCEKWKCLTAVERGEIVPRPERRTAL